MSSFRPYVWDPSLIVGQMICMQATFYTLESVLFIIAWLCGHEATLANVFSVQVTFANSLIQLLSAVGCAFALVRVVQRARQCLDFVCTLHLFHLIFVIIFTGAFPTELSWWILQLFSTTICTVLGEYLCARFESREIQLSQPSKYDL